MQSYANVTQENNKIANNKPKVKNNDYSTFQFKDNRPEAITQRKLQETADNFIEKQPIQKKANNTGLPNHLKSGIENLSGYSMNDVKVHYNSNKPAQLQAHAYAQGTNIHIASGQERHLPHEAWHVVQQKQGRVRPTMQMKGKININDDAGLEKEADIMGARALHLKINKGKTNRHKSSINRTSYQRVVQRNRFKLLETLRPLMLNLNNHSTRAAYMKTAEQNASSANYALQQIASDSYSASTYDTHYAGVFNTKRRDLGVKYKDMTPPTLRDVIYKRNTEKYDDKLGPTTEYLLQTKSPIDIILSSVKPNNDVGGTLMKMVENIYLPDDTIENLIKELQ